MELSLIIPACNEEARIRETLDSYVTYFQNSGISFELIVEMDGCTDSTSEIVMQMSLAHPQIRYLEFTDRLGKGGGLVRGFHAANGDYIGFVDADGSTAPQEFIKILESVRSGYDGAIGSRRMKGSVVSNQGLSRKLLSKSFNLMVRALFLLPHHDTQCGAKIFRAPALNKILAENQVNGYIIDVMLLYLAKKNRYRVEEVPIAWEDKAGSKVSIFHTTIDMFSSTLALRLYYSPMRRLMSSKSKSPNNVAETVRSPRI